MTVLVLADDIDLSADAMMVELRRRGVPAARVNLAWFPQRLTFAAELIDGRWLGELRTELERVSLDDIDAIWLRAPTAFQFPAELTGPEHRHAFTEAKLGLGGVLMSLPARWVNRPDRAATAGYKPAQLAAAHRAGMVVLPTLITNEPAVVREFAARHDEVVTKMLGAPAIHEAGGRRVAYTDRLTPELMGDLGGVELTAHQFQRWAPKLCECRVIAVGGALFAALIHAGSARSFVDWRSDYPALSYQVIEPPPAVASGIHHVLDQLELSYAAFDFVIGPDHIWYFLEVNAGGQYGFLEEHAGLPITATLAALLAGTAA